MNKKLHLFLLMLLTAPSFLVSANTIIVVDDRKKPAPAVQNSSSQASVARNNKVISDTLCAPVSRLSASTFMRTAVPLAIPAALGVAVYNGYSLPGNNWDKAVLGLAGFFSVYSLYAQEVLTGALSTEQTTKELIEPRLNKLETWETKLNELNEKAELFVKNAKEIEAGMSKAVPSKKIQVSKTVRQGNLSQETTESLTGVHAYLGSQKVHDVLGKLKEAHAFLDIFFEPYKDKVPVQSTGWFSWLSTGKRWVSDSFNSFKFSWTNTGDLDTLCVHTLYYVVNRFTEECKATIDEIDETVVFNTAKLEEAFNNLTKVVNPLLERIRYRKMLLETSMQWQKVGLVGLAGRLSALALAYAVTRNYVVPQVCQHAPGVVAKAKSYITSDKAVNAPAPATPTVASEAVSAPVQPSTTSWLKPWAWSWGSKAPSAPATPLVEPTAFERQAADRFGWTSNMPEHKGE